MSFRAEVKTLVYKFNAFCCRDDGPKIVYYHDVTGMNAVTSMSTPFDLFQRQIDVARNNGYDFVAAPPERRLQLMVCFDDGFRGVWDRREFFVKERIYPTISVAIDLVGRPGYLTWAEIAELRAMGFRFSSHTWSHRSLTEVPDSELMHELRDAREELSMRTAGVIDGLCFPRGKFSRRVLDAAIRAGFTIGYASVPGRAIDPLDECGQELRVLPRMLVQDAALGRFTDILHGAMLPFRGYYLRRHFDND